MADESFSDFLAHFAQSFIPLSQIRVRHAVDRDVASDAISDTYYADLKHGYGVRAILVLHVRVEGEPEGRRRFVERMTRVVSIWGNLDHPNIVRLIGFYASPDDDKGWLISPWMEGGTLHNYINQHNFDTKTRIQLCCDTSLGTAYLHSLSPPICHGNLTSGNILVNENGTAMISNFLLAEPVTQNHVGRSTDEGIEGNVRWMSPEALLEQPPYTEKGDIWAFGCVCYEILTSKIPYSEIGYQVGPLTSRIMQGRPPGTFDSVDLPSSVARLLTSCWSIQPEDRPAMEGVATTLLDLRDEYEDRPASTTDMPWIETRISLQNSTITTWGVRADIARGVMVKENGLTCVVAVKTFHEEVMRVVNSQASDCWDMLEHEAKRWRQLRHNNIVPVFGLIWEPRPTLIYQWYDGGDLEAHLQSNPNMEVSEKLALLQQAAHGLEFLHSQSPAIIHRHVHVSHVLLASSGEAAILGCHLPLGIAGSAEDDTTPFMFPEPQAPEIIMNEGVTTATDVFGFGAMILQALTGEPLHYQESTHTRTMKILEGRLLDRNLYPRLPETHSLWNMIEACLTLDAADRPSMIDVARKLAWELDQCEGTFENAGEGSEHYGPFEHGEGRSRDEEVGGPDVGAEVAGELRVDENVRPFSGGFADVFKGTLVTSSGRHLTVAVKRLRTRNSPYEFGSQLSLDTATRIVKREALIWKGVKHQYIVPFLGFRIEEQPCLVSPWYDNGNLAEFLSSHPDFPQEEKLRLVYETAQALEYLHTSNPPICHADIKPSNVLVSDSIHAQLTDFGLSNLQESESSNVPQPVGTKGYQAPELLFGSGPTLESDMFAFGSFVIAVMSGRPPFQDRNAAQTIFAFTRGILPSPQDHPGLSPRVWELVWRCFSLEPAKRPTILQAVSILENENENYSRNMRLIEGNDNSDNFSPQDGSYPIAHPTRWT